ncbi:MAG: L,D-transpeptidase family protein [Clostridia bacterium]|nr:L,D-transpeptidase family protein [Clostridia bacterium]
MSDNMKMNRSGRGRIAAAAVFVLTAVLLLSAFAGCSTDRGPAVTATPDNSPVMFITPKPTEQETAAPETEPPATELPSAEPAETDVPESTEEPPEPTEQPTKKPTDKPTERPTEKPTDKPTETPTEAPTERPTEEPTNPPDTNDGEWDPSVYLVEEDDLPYARYYIEVSVNAQLVYIYSVDENGEKDKLVKTMICSTGREGKTPLRTWIILDNDTQDNEITDSGFLSRYDFEWVKGCAVQYITRLWKAEWDDNGKLKVSTSSYLFHSTPFDSKDKNTLRAADWNKLGTAVSDGCVRLCVRDAHWIYSRVAPYSIVRTIEGEPDPETWAKLKLPDIPEDVKRDPTDIY